MNYFTFDGIDSRTYNTYIATSNAFDAPGREDEVIKVPGSNNIYYLTEGTYKPFDIKLYCYIPSNMQVKTDDLRNFLLSKGTCTYTEAIRPNEFRVARFIEAYELDVSDRVSAAFVLTFKAQPQRYLTTNTPITTTATADTTTDTTMSLNTVPTPLNISLNGNTTQEGSSGKNLFDYTTVTNTGIVDDSGTTGTYQTRLWSAKIGVSPSTTYTFKTTAYSSNNERIYINRLIYYAQDGTFLRRNADYNTLSEATFTTPSDVYFLVIDLRTQRLTTNLTNTLLKGNTQLEKGSTATAYEPHISPTNPQVIHNVLGDNTINVTGKNILSPFVIGIVLNTTNGSESASVYGATTDFINVDFSAHPSYYISGLSLTIHSYICAYNSQKQFLGRTASTIRETRSLTASSFPSGTAQGTGDIAYLRVCYYQQGTDTDASTANNYLTQLEVGNSRTDFEPYTRQSYPLYLPVENLLPTFNATSGTSNGITYSSDGSKIYLNGTSTSGVSIVFTVNGVLPSSEFYLCLFNNVTNNNVAFVIDNGNTTVLSLSLGTETNRKQKYTTHYGETYTRVRVYINSAGQVFDNAVIMPMITYTPTVHYNAYGNPSIELNKIGTYQDYIYKNGGKWYLYKEFNKIDMGNVAWTNGATDTSGYYRRQTNGLIPLAKIIGTTVMPLLMCEKYIAGTLGDVYNRNSGLIGTNNAGEIAVYDSNYSGGSADNERFKTDMAGTSVIYQLATPTNTEITDTTLINQLNNIEKAYSYNGTTNILQVSNDNGFMLAVVSLHSNDVSSTYKGEPIITVNSTGLIYFNGCVIKVNQAPMTINSQTMQAYNGTVNLNNYIEANDFPMIEAGNNVIGSEMPLTIVPNYWKL